MSVVKGYCVQGNHRNGTGIGYIIVLHVKEPPKHAELLLIDGKCSKYASYAIFTCSVLYLCD